MEAEAARVGVALSGVMKTEPERFTRTEDCCIDGLSILVGDCPSVFQFPELFYYHFLFIIVDVFRQYSFEISVNIYTTRSVP